MDMSNVKTIFDNNMQKNVKKIADANGNILWYKVPDGYRKVEYLESSDGTSRIMTDILPTDTIKAEIKFQLNSTHRDSAGVFGAFPTGGNRFQVFGSSTSLTLGIGGGYNGYNSKDSLSTSTHIAILDGKNRKVSLDGVSQVATTGTYSSPVGSAELAIFASNQGANRTPDNSKIYFVRIWDDDILTHHFIPLVRNADDKPGMYDLVNDVFYTNAGTGEFTWKEIDGNLFLGFGSRWCCNFSCTITSGAFATLADSSHPRSTYFFACKPNTTYRYTATTGGDRFCVYSIKQLYGYPPKYTSTGAFPYGVSSSDIRIIENRNTTQINSTKDYTFTTGQDDKMVYIYFALEKRPTGVRIVEV